MLDFKKFSAGLSALVGLLVTAGSAQAALVAQWAMDDNAADATVSESVASADGTFQDATGDPNTNAHTAAGRIGRSLVFDGDDDIVTTTFAGVLGSADRAVSFWLKGVIDGQDDFPYLVSWGNPNVPADVGKRWSIRLNDNGDGIWAPRIEIQGNGRNGSVNVLDGQWNNIVITWDNAAGAAGETSMYVNGVLDAAGSGGFTQIVDTAEVDFVSIGSASAFDVIGDQNKLRFDGLLDDVRIYDHALSQAEVTALQNIPGVLLGDFDGDLDADGADFLFWQRDRSVGLLSDWGADFGTTTAVSAAAAVPEPGSLLLTCILVMSVAVSRRARQLPIR